MKEFTAIDLFCGSGAVTQGLKNGGFKVLAAVDCDQVASLTYKKNHPEVLFFEKDIKRLNPKIIHSAVLRNDPLDLLVVCAPCQPFSSQNRFRIEKDERMELILQASRFAKALRPSVIFFENVPGIAGPNFAYILERLRFRLGRWGFTLNTPVRLDAADFGVPQRRQRCVMFATKKGVSSPEVEKILGTIKKRSVKDAIGELTPLKSGERAQDDALHFSRNHLPIALQRMAHISKNGGTRFDLPLELELECHKGKKCFPDVYGRMKWEDVAPTLTTGCTDITRGRFIHPRDDRAITLREAARLQTFPDDYYFEGKSGQIATQIGNAVPVDFIAALAPAIREVLSA